MLIQSHEGVIALIPALPKIWDHGAFYGLRARGGIEIDIRWESFEVKEICLKPDNAGKFILELPETQKTITFKDKLGNTYTATDNKLILEITEKIRLTAK